MGELILHGVVSENEPNFARNGELWATLARIQLVFLATFSLPNTIKFLRLFLIAQTSYLMLILPKSNEKDKKQVHGAVFLTIPFSLKNLGFAGIAFFGSFLLSNPLPWNRRQPLVHMPKKLYPSQRVARASDREQHSSCRCSLKTRILNDSTGIRLLPQNKFQFLEIC